MIENAPFLNFLFSAVACNRVPLVRELLVYCTVPVEAGRVQHVAFLPSMFRLRPNLFFLLIVQMGKWSTNCLGCTVVQQRYCSTLGLLHGTIISPTAPWEAWESWDAWEMFFLASHISQLTNGAHIRFPRSYFQKIGSESTNYRSHGTACTREHCIWTKKHDLANSLQYFCQSRQRKVLKKKNSHYFESSEQFEYSWSPSHIIIRHAARFTPSHPWCKTHATPTTSYDNCYRYWEFVAGKRDLKKRHKTKKLK